VTDRETKDKPRGLKIVQLVHLAEFAGSNLPRYSKILALREDGTIIVGRVWHDADDNGLDAAERQVSRGDLRDEISWSLTAHPLDGEGW
jgi:hypothetical protein